MGNSENYKNLLAEVARIKSGDTADFKTFANTQELAEHLGVYWQPLFDSLDKFSPDFMEDRDQPTIQEERESFD